MSVAIEDEGFRFGYGVFETLRVIGGCPCMVAEHRRCMEQAAVAMGLPMPDWDGLLPCGMSGDGVWRWFLTPSGLFTMEQVGYSRMQDITLELGDLTVCSSSWEARYKTLSYLLRKQARAAVEPNEVLLCNERGHVVSAAMANLFWVKDGKLKTPAVEEGCRAGTVRAWVLKNAPLPVVEVYGVQLFEMDDADQLFLTNSLQGILPVRRWCGIDMEPGEETLQLRQSFERSLRGSAMVK